MQKIEPSGDVAYKVKSLVQISVCARDVLCHVAIGQEGGNELGNLAVFAQVKTMQRKNIQMSNGRPNL